MVNKLCLVSLALFCLALFKSTSASDWHVAPGPLQTPWARDVSPEKVWPEYPRPQMVRKDWLNLNGLWDFAVTAKNAEREPESWQGQILVPFCIESALSGVMKPLSPDQRLWYRRKFTIPKEWNQPAEQRVILHFGAVDWETTVFLNGQRMGSHRGGYDSFTMDITRYLKKDGPQELTVSVWDPNDAGWQMRGKQVLHPGGAAYTCTSGIWQTAWLEPVPKSSVDNLKLVPDVKAKTLHLTIDARTPPGSTAVRVTVLDGNTTVATVDGTLGAEITKEVTENLAWYRSRLIWVTTDLDIRIENPKLWSTDSPFLYSVNVELKDPAGIVLDSVQSYFGIRSVSIESDTRGFGRLMLNGKPQLLFGALDQGFWPDGIYTAPSDEALRFDIEAAKKLGLTAIRKHIKVEPDRYYYWADKLGLLILQDMPSANAGDSFTDIPLSPEAAAQFESEARLLIQQRWNHPSIIMWDIFNEGWGQFDTLRHVKWVKALDPSRLVNEASGFPRHGGGDVLDCHGGIPPKDPRRISLDSETCGFGLTVSGHSWPGKPWSTGTYDPETGKETGGPLYALDEPSKQWYTQRMVEFYGGFAQSHERTGSSGDFKVQLYDVETESNGMLSYDRAVWKVYPDQVRAACTVKDKP